jgi:hypothetical protein
MTPNYVTVTTIKQKVYYVTTGNSKQTLDLKNIDVYWNPLSRGEILLGFVFHHTDYKLRGGDIRDIVLCFIKLQILARISSLSLLRSQYNFCSGLRTWKFW